MHKGKKVGEKRALPGKNGTKLIDQRNLYVPRGVFQIAPIFISRGKGALLWDVDDNEYIDFSGGISVLNIGQCNDEVIKVITEQADKHLHTCFHVLMYESYVSLAKKLTEITPGNFPKQVLLVNSGAEAVENSIKIARRYTKKFGVIAFENAFHGRTSLALGLTSQVRNYKYGFGPMDLGIYRFPYAYSYRAAFDTNDIDYAKYCLKKIDEGLRTYLSTDEIAAIIIEPVLGEGGYVVPPIEFIQGLRKICDNYGILFIADEIQCGMGRTGKMWAMEHFDVAPDILLAAKSLGGGLVLSAVIGRTDIMDAVDVGGIGGTYGGNPLSCVAALKAIEITQRQNLMNRATMLGSLAFSRLEKMKGKYAIIGDVRGLGSMIGIELVRDRITKDPAPEETREICHLCHERGLILMSCGVFHNVIRLMYPLIITEEELMTGLDIMQNAIKQISQK